METTRGERLGSFLYSAPEQRYRGGSATPATDVFALGLILNELFTGQVAQGIGYRLIGAVYPTLEYLDGVVELMIQQDPLQRLQTAGQVLQRLHEAEEHAEGLERIGVLERQAEESRNPVVAGEVPPTRVVRRDYINGALVFWFEAQPDWAWGHALSKLRADDDVDGLEASSWRVTLDFAALTITQDDAVAAGRRFLSWLPRIDEEARAIRATMAIEARRKAEGTATQAAAAEGRRLEIIRELKEPKA
jgi:hypothetical protein